MSSTQHGYHDAPQVVQNYDGLIPDQTHHNHNQFQYQYPAQSQYSSPASNEPYYSDKQGWEANQAPQVIDSSDHAPELAPHQSHHAKTATATGNGPGWARRYRWWTAAAVAVVIIIAIVVGVVVGVVQRPKQDGASSGTSGANNSGPNSNGPRPNTTDPAFPKPACDQAVCPQLVSAVEHQSSLYIFARSIDKLTWYRVGNGEQWTDPWQQTPLTGNLASQPMAKAWEFDTFNFTGDGTGEVEQRITVLAVDEVRGVVLATTVRNGVFSKWIKLGIATANSMPQMCVIQAGSLTAVQRNRMDVWSTEKATTGVIHEFWDLGRDIFGSADSTDSTWDRAISGLTTASNVGVVCRNDSIYHDIFVYQDQRLKYISYIQYNQTYGGWGSLYDVGGKLAGSPVVQQVTNERMDFFGIGTDKQMYWSTWTKSATKFSSMVSLRGSFVSEPAVISLQLGNDYALLVFALGSDYKLKYRYQNAGIWSPDWVDMGVYGNSAPTAVHLKAKGRIALLVGGRNTELNFTSYPAPSSASTLSLPQLTWSGIGGNITYDFFQSK